MPCRKPGMRNNYGDLFLHLASQNSQQAILVPHTLFEFQNFNKSHVEQNQVTYRSIHLITLMSVTLKN